VDTVWASWIVGAWGIYAAIGLLVGLAFVTVGVARVDPSAQGSKLGFRLMILPASIALWPLVAAWWLGGRQQPPEERNAHREAARG